MRAKNIATKDDDEEEEEDPEKRTAVPRARQRAAKAHLPMKPKLYLERWSAWRPTRGPGPAVMTDTGWWRPHERAMTPVPTRIRQVAGQKAAAGVVNKKTYHSAHTGSGARSPQALPDFAGPKSVDGVV